MFVGSESGDIFALDAKTGCTYWTFHAKAGIRTAPSVGPYKRANGTNGFAVYVADGAANAYAVDAETGQEIWSRRMDDHIYAKSTGSLTVLRRTRLRAGRRRRRRGTGRLVARTSAARSAAACRRSMPTPAR